MKSKKRKKKKGDVVMDENKVYETENVEETKPAEQPKMKISPPWVIYAKKVKALFEQDPEIKIEYDNDKMELRLYVRGQSKADALTQLLPPEKEFGNVKLKIAVIPANDLKSKSDLLLDAFYRNPALVGYVPVEGQFDAKFLVFQKKVVQFFADNMGDINGNVSTLYEDLARDVFVNVENTFFCTNSSEQ